jgi:N-acyl amino acid synthase of PEP-CTERM/exosortase system
MMMQIVQPESDTALIRGNPDPEFGDLFANYHQHFTVVTVNNSKLLDQVYRLRHQVYCVEKRFEDPDEHLDGRETDEHDDISKHILLLHKKSGAAVGTARIIIPHLGTAWRPLPIQQVLESKFRQEFERLPIQRTAEISRFAVSKEFRRWWRETHCAAADSCPPGGSNEQQLMRYITFGLLHHIVQLSIEHGIAYLSAVMEPSLIRMCAKLGLEFEPIGGLVEYHGIRQPCVAILADLIERSRDRLTPLWQFVSFREPFPPHPSAVQ